MFGWNLWLQGALGGFLMQLCSIYDGCDGEIARVKFQYYHLGDWLDTIFDDITNCLFFAGVAAWSFYFYWPRSFYFIWELHLLLGNGFPMFVMYYYLVKSCRNRKQSGLHSWVPRQADGGFVGRVLGKLKYLTKRDFHLFAFMWMGIFGVLWGGSLSDLRFYRGDGDDI